MLIAIRIVGIILLLLAVASLASLVFVDIDTLTSPIAVIVRYSLMAIAGIGFILLKKWGVFVYLGSFAINWISYFTVHEGQGSAGPPERTGPWAGRPALLA